MDVNVERAEEVLMHKELLELAQEPDNRPVFTVRLVQVKTYNLSCFIWIPFFFVLPSKLLNRNSFRLINWKEVDPLCINVLELLWSIQCLTGWNELFIYCNVELLTCGPSSWFSFSFEICKRECLHALYVWGRWKIVSLTKILQMFRLLLDSTIRS